MAKSAWVLPFGANVYRDEHGKQATEFRVWAPRARMVELEHALQGKLVHDQMHPGDDGVFWIERDDCPPGTRYKYRIDGGLAFPDPYSRSQPEGVHGPSEVIDPRDHDWSDGSWDGLRPERLVIYELHVGTFTRWGTFDAVRDELKQLKDLGVTAIELMPVAAFPGRRGWGYDGVSLFAPYAGYGGPQGLKRLIDAAHGQQIGVILDVVYNHLGPDGNYLGVYSDRYFTDRFHTPWGAAVNFERVDGPSMRRLVLENACYWVHEYHLDGLRLDATHAIYDDSDPHILKELSDRVRASVDRSVVLIAENENNETPLIDPVRAGGAGLDGVWADDFHHQMRVFLTGEREGYFADYAGRVEDIATTIRDGFFYQGQQSAHRGGPRGYPVKDNPAHHFVFCLENHDQVGNRAHGERLGHLIDRDDYRVASLVLLTAPETPLLFMGQEFAASTPFLYFTDHHAELGRLVTAGRREEFGAFSAFQDPHRRDQIPDPQDAETYRRSILNLDERRLNSGIYTLYKDLLRLRREDPVFARPSRRRLHVTPIGDRALALHRWVEGGHRLVVANFGGAMTIAPADLAGTAAGPAREWEITLHTRDRRYGGEGKGPRFAAGEGRRRIEVPAQTGLILAGR